MRQQPTDAPGRRSPWPARPRRVGPRPVCYPLIASCVFGIVFGLDIGIGPGPGLQAQSAIVTGGITIQGRCVAADTGEPLARCEVDLIGRDSVGGPLFWTVGDWSDPPSVLTGEDGRFRVTLRLPSGEPWGDRHSALYDLNITHTNHVSWQSSCTFRTARDLGSIDYGTIELPLGVVRPRIRVVDEKGHPQPGVLVRLLHEGRQRERLKEQESTAPTVASSMPESHFPASVDFVSDIDGYPHFVEPLEHGRWSVEVAGRKILRPLSALVLPADGPAEIALAPVPAADTIRGEVVDGSGMRVGALLLHLAVGDSLDRFPFPVVRDGRFLLLRPEGSGDGEEEEAVIQRREAAQYARWIEVARLRWGEQNARIVLPSTIRVRFEVRLRGSGAPVEDLNLYCLPLADDAAQVAVRVSDRFAGGCADVKMVPGRYRLLVYPRTQGTAASDWIPVDIEPENDGEAETGVTSVKVLLDAVAPRTVRIVSKTATAAALAGAEVEVFANGIPERAYESALVAPIQVIEAGTPGPFPPPLIRLVARATVDARGRAVLFAPLADSAAVWVRVRGEGLQTTIEELSECWHTDGVIEVQVPGGARLTGRVTPLARIDALDISTEPGRYTARSHLGGGLANYLAARRPGIVVFTGPGDARFEERLFTLDAEGRFVCDGLPPGRVRLGLVRFLREGRRGRDVREDPRVHDLGSFEVGLDKPAVVELKVPDALR